MPFLVNPVAAYLLVPRPAPGEVSTNLQALVALVINTAVPLSWSKTTSLS